VWAVERLELTYLNKKKKKAKEIVGRRRGPLFVFVLQPSPNKRLAQQVVAGKTMGSRPRGKKKVCRRPLAQGNFGGDERGEGGERGRKNDDQRRQLETESRAKCGPSGET